MNRTAILTIIFASLWSVSGFSQETSEFTKKELILGVNLSGNSYYGDINYNPSGGFLSSSTYLTMNPGVHFTFRQNQPNYLSMVFTGGYAQILAQNPDLDPFYYGDPTDPRSLYIAPRFVFTDYMYADVNGRFTPVRNIRAFARPYVQAGLGGLLFFPLKNGTIRPKGSNLERGESFSTISMSANTIIGTDINFSKNASLNLGTQFRFPMTDYMDWYGGKNVNSFRKRSGDLIMSIQVGANFKIFETNRPTIFQPRIFNNIIQEKIPEDSIVLASTDDAILEYLIRKNFITLVDMNYSMIYPEDWIPLAVLAKSIDCDSLSRMADQRISVLYAENLQLREQYTKIENKTNNSPSLASNEDDGAMRQEVMDAKAETEMAKMQVASMRDANQVLLRRMDSMQNVIAQMQLANNEVPKQLPTPTHTECNEDSFIRIIAQKDFEISKLQDLLKVGTKPQTIGESEKYAVLEKENLTLKAENEQLRNGTGGTDSPGFVELQQRYNSAMLQNEKLQKDLDDSQTTIQGLVAKIEQGNDADITHQGVANKEIDSLKKETLTLYTEISSLTEIQTIKDSIAQAQLAEVNAKLNTSIAENEGLRTKVTALETASNPSVDAAGIQQALAEALAKQNESEVKYAELQGKINKYEADLIATVQSNDSLTMLVQNLQAGNPTNPMVSTNTPAGAIDSLTKVIDGYVIREKSLQSEVEEVRAVALKAQEDKNMAEDNLVTAKKENTSLTGRIADLQNNVPSAYAVEFKIARDRIDSLTRVNEEIVNRYNMSDPTGSAPVIANSEYQNLKARLDASETAVKDLERENQELKQSNAALSMSNDAQAVMDMRSQLEGLKRENTTLQSLTENQKTRITELEQKNNTSVVAADPEERALQIQQLESENYLLRQQVTQFAGLNAEMADMQNKNLELLTENKNLKAIAGGTPSDVVNNTQLSEKEEEIASLNTQLQDVATKYEKQNHEYQLLLAASQNSRERELEQQVESMQGQVADLQKHVASLTSENDSLINSSSSTELVAMRTQVEEFRNSNTELRETNTELLKKVNEAEDKLVAEEALLEQMKIEVGTNPESNAKLHQEIANLKDQLQQANARVGAPTPNVELEGQITTLKAQLADNERTTAEMKTELAALNEQKAAWQTSIPVGDEGMAIMKKEIADLQADNEQKQAQIDRLTADGVSPVNAEAQTQILALQEENNKKQIEIDRLTALTANTSPNLNASEEVTALQGQVNSLNGLLSEKESENKLLTNQVHNLNTKVEDLNVQLAAKPMPAGAAELAIMQKSLEAILAENTELKTKVEAFGMTGGAGSGASNGDMQEQLKTLQDDKERLTTEVATLNKRITDMSVEGGKDVIPEMQAQLNQKEEEIVSLKHTLNNVPSVEEFAKMQVRNESLTDQIETQDEQIADLNKQITDLKTAGSGDNTPLLERIAVLEKEVSEQPDITAYQVQIQNLTAENARLKSEQPAPAVDNESAAKIASLEAKVAEQQAKIDENSNNEAMIAMQETIEVQKEQINDLKAAGEGNVAVEMVSSLQAKVAAQEEQIKQLKNNTSGTSPADAQTIANLQAQVAFQAAQINKLESSSTTPSLEVADLQAKIADQEAQINQLKTAQEGNVAVEMISTLQAKIADQDAKIKQLESAGGTSSQDAQTIANLQAQVAFQAAQINKLESEGVDESSAALIASLKATVADQEEQIKQLQNGNSSPATPENEMITILQSRIAAQEEQIKQLQNGATPESGTNEMIASLQIQIKNQQDEIDQLKTANPNANYASIAAERDAVRRQYEEIFVENDDYRKALGNALASMEQMRKGNTMPTPEGNERERELIAKVSELENALAEAQRNTGGSDEGKLEALQRELSNALASNDRLEDELAAAKSMGESNNNNEELNQLKADKNDLKNQVVVKSAEISELKQEISDLRAQMGSQSIGDNSPRIDSLNMVIDNLQQRIMVLNTIPTPSNNVMPEKPAATSISEQQMNQKIAEIEAREKRSKAREEYIESLNIDYQLQVEKGKYLNAKEIELQILAQKLSGFPDYFAEVTQDGAPCSTVSASLDKQETMERINSYFNTLGYKFKTQDGKMIFENVMVPEISKKPINIVFYMMTSKSGKRIFQGVFQFVDNKNYITADRYPNETTRALKLMQRLSQQ